MQHDTRFLDLNEEESSFAGLQAIRQMLESSKQSANEPFLERLGIITQTSEVKFVNFTSVVESSEKFGCKTILRKRHSLPLSGFEEYIKHSKQFNLLQGFTVIIVPPHIYESSLSNFA